LSIAQSDILMTIDTIQNKSFNVTQNKFQFCVFNFDHILVAKKDFVELFASIANCSNTIHYLEM